MLYCENCHAPISEESAKCPYCGAFNTPGGERQYMEQLYDLKEDVAEISEAPKRAFRGEMGKAGRILIRTFLVFAGLAAVMGAVAVFLVHKSMDYEISSEEMKEQAVWEREVFPQLDALYEQGDYEGVWECVYANDENGHRSWSAWEHYDFINTYLCYQSCLENTDEISTGDYDADDEMDCIIDALFLIQERTYASYTDEEEALIEGYCREIRQLLDSELGVDSGKLDALFEESCVEDEYGVYLDYDTAKKKVRQYVKERNR